MWKEAGHKKNTPASSIKDSYLKKRVNDVCDVAICLTSKIVATAIHSKEK